ncbi:GLEYA adhesin domain [Cordyceps militaris]|uniref:GLEYA adhesin domain n=1 Tax=Cordyceps militaris TaxID=73501 RepID=A0A2H4S7F4_CORMI|nr:GLEYA adhesin domain [Cordyceps militaris]
MLSIIGVALLVAGFLPPALGWSQSVLFPLSTTRPSAFLSWEAPSSPPQFYYTTSVVNSDNWIGFFPQGTGPGREGDHTYTGWAIAPDASGLVTADNEFDLCTPAGEYEAYFFKKGDRGHPLGGPSRFTYPGNADYKRCDDGRCLRSTGSCACRNGQKLCKHQCISDYEPCAGRCDEGQGNCNGKCLSTDFPCNGQCTWGKRRCNDRCINADLPCSGQCADGQRVCNGKCISNDAPCEGKCGQGKRVCDNTCINDDSPCNGQCESGNKVCNGKCIKSGALCCSEGQKDCHGRCIPSSNDCEATTCGLHAGDTNCVNTNLVRWQPGYFTPEKCARVCRSEPECKSSVAATQYDGGCWLLRGDVKTCAGAPGWSHWTYSDRDCYPPESHTALCDLRRGGSPCTGQAEQIQYDAGASTPEQCAAACKSGSECKSYVVGLGNNAGCYLYREDLSICRGRPDAANWKYFDRDC